LLSTYFIFINSIPLWMFFTHISLPNKNKVASSEGETDVPVNETRNGWATLPSFNSNDSAVSKIT